MRLMPRIVVFLLATLLAFWFTTENAGEIVRIDFAFFRIDLALPVVIFASVILGMGATLLVGWRADRRKRPPTAVLSHDYDPAPLAEPREPLEWETSDEPVGTEHEME
jgi:hypothetical protein